MGLISDGTTIFNGGSMSSGIGGSMVFIKKLTASSSSTLTFHHGTSGVILDSTFKEYLFTFKNIHTSGNDIKFFMQGNAVGGSGFDETITSTYFRALHKEDNSATSLTYEAGQDQAQGTSSHELIDALGSDNDQCVGGSMTLYNPGSTTFVKHFTSICSNTHSGDYAHTVFTGGYFNTTTAIDEIQFKPGSGNFDVGDICLYGIA